MSTPTYTLIDSVTLGATAASVTFSSISATGKGDLVLVVDAKSSTGTVEPGIRLNADSGSNYGYVVAYGDGSAGASFSGTTTAAGSQGTIPTYERALEVTTILDFSATDKHKSMLHRWNRPTETVRMGASRWASTAAVTSLSVGSGGTFAIGSTFHLYQLVSE
jgi:hypothetical protein